MNYPSTETSFRKFNPGLFQSDPDVINQFCIRETELELILDVLRGNIESPTRRHILIAAPHGLGKTMLLARTAAELRGNGEFSGRLLPVRFPYARYGISDPASFWLEALFHLADEIATAYPELAQELRERHVALTTPARQTATAVGHPSPTAATAVATAVGHPSPTAATAAATVGHPLSAEAILATITAAADRIDKRLVLMVECLEDICLNAGKEFGGQLRDSLESEPRIMLLATTTVSFESSQTTQTTAQTTGQTTGHPPNKSAKGHPSSMASSMGHPSSKSSALSMGHPSRNKARNKGHPLPGGEGQPFSGMFRLLELEPLALEECRELWQSISGADAPARMLRPLQILTAGNPRLLVTIAIAANRRPLLEQVVALADERTEYFNGLLEALPNSERRVLAAILELWQASTTGEIAAFARMDVRAVSTMLKRLIDRGLVLLEFPAKAGRRRYTAAEPMHCIWYKLQRGGNSAEVELLIGFMAAFYNGSPAGDFRIPATEWETGLALMQAERGPREAVAVAADLREAIGENPAI